MRVRSRLPHASRRHSTVAVWAALAACGALAIACVTDDEQPENSGDGGNGSARPLLPLGVGKHASTAPAASAPAGEWDVTIIDTDVGDHVDVRIAADARGFLHVAYTAHRGAVRYAMGDAFDGFNITEVEPDDGQGETWSPAIALGGSRAAGGESVVPQSWVAPPDGTAADVTIAWSRKNTNEIRLAHKSAANASFAVQTIATGEDVAFGSTDLELDADGAAHVTWIDGTIDPGREGPLQHTFQTESGFVTERAASDAFARGTSMAFDASGALQVAFYQRDAFLASKGESGWTTRALTEAGAGAGLDPALATDGVGGAHITMGGTGIGAEYGELVDGAWRFDLVADGFFDGVMSSLVLDVDAQPHAVWLAGGGLEYATRAGGVWHREVVVAEVEPWTTPDLVLDADGRVSVVAAIVRDDGTTALALLSRATTGD
jgi:hypothetical protein